MEIPRERFEYDTKVVIKEQTRVNVLLWLCCCF